MLRYYKKEKKNNKELKSRNEKIKEYFDAPRISILHQWALIFGMQIVLEAIFLVGSGLGIDFKTFTRILLFSLSSSGLVAAFAYLLKAKWSNWFISIYLLIHAIFALSQLGYKNYMGSYFSFRTVISKIGDVSVYAWDFLMYLKIQYFLVLIPIGLYLYIVRKYVNQHKTPFHIKYFGAFVSGALVLQLVAVISLTWWPQTTTAVSLQELYYRPTQLDSALRQFGVSRFLMRDLMTTISNADSEIVFEPEQPPVDEGEIVPDYKRTFDDTKWNAMMEAELNPDIQAIDKYLINRPITPKNEMTGIFKDKNVIYVMIEALDYAAMDPAIAPTLTRLMREGLFFENYFAPTSACSTGDSELMSITSLLTIPGLCNHDEYAENSFNNSLFELFKKDDYYASSYHNYTDYYYMRNTMHANMGSQAYYDFNALGIDPFVPWPNWPSDVDLVEKSMDLFINYDKFFSYLITVNMHNPYDRPNNIGDKYYAQVQSLYPEANEFEIRYKSKVIETDRSLKIMLNRLEKENKLDDTVIVLYADHHMLKTPFDIIDDMSPVDRLEGYNIHRSPMVIYNSTIEPQVISTVASTKDLVPTLANLFDLDYDPRLYLGVDIFSDQVDHYALFQDGGWVTQEGFYDPIQQEFTSYDGSTILADEEILKYNQYSRSFYQLSESILTNDYFKYRDFVNPVEFDVSLIQ